MTNCPNQFAVALSSRVVNRYNDALDRKGVTEIEVPLKSIVQIQDCSVALICSHLILRPFDKAQLIIGSHRIPVFQPVYRHRPSLTRPNRSHSSYVPIL